MLGTIDSVWLETGFQFKDYVSRYSISHFGQGKARQGKARQGKARQGWKSHTAKMVYIYIESAPTCV